MKMFGDTPEYFTVKRALVYPKYTNVSFYNDVGLIELNRRVDFKPTLRPACLPPKDFKIDSVQDFVTVSYEASAAAVGKLVKVRLAKVPGR